MSQTQHSTPCHCSTARRAARKLTAMYDRALRSSGLTLPQFSLLRRLRRAGPLSITRLAQVVELERSTLTRNLRPLEQAGYLELRSSDNDARERVVVLTQSGMQILDISVPLWRKAQVAIERQLGKDRLKTLHELVNDIEALAQ